MDGALGTDGFVAGEAEIWEFVFWMFDAHDGWGGGFSGWIVVLIDRGVGLVGDGLGVAGGWGEWFLMFVGGRLWLVVVGIGDFPADFGHTSIILKLFIILSTVLNLSIGFNGPIDSLELNDTGGVKLGLILAPGAAVVLIMTTIHTNEFRGQFST